MRKYLLSAFLVLSFPQIAVAESNLVINQSHQQLSIINDWLAYQEFESTLQQTNEEFQKKYENSIFRNFEVHNQRMEIEKQKLKQNKILKNILENLHPQENELIELKKLWLDLLQHEHQTLNEAEYAAHDGVNTKLNEIDTLSSALDIKTFHVIQQHNPPEYVRDWMNYTQLKINIKQQNKALDESFDQEFAQTTEENKIKLQQSFIKEKTRIQLDMLKGFKTNLSELKDMIAMQIKVKKATEKMNLNAVSNSGILNTDTLNEIGEISNQIETLEYRFEAKIV